RSVEGTKTSVQVLVGLHDTGPGATHADLLQRRGHLLLPQGIVLTQTCDRVGQRGGVIGRDQRACAAIGQQLPQGGQIAGHDRYPVSHRFHRLQRGHQTCHPCVDPRNHHHVECGLCLEGFLGVHSAGQDTSFPDAQTLGSLQQLRAYLAVTHQQDPNRPIVLVHECHGIDQRRKTLVRVQAGNRTDHEFLGGDPVTGPEGVPVGTFRQQVLVHGVEGQGDPLGVHTTFEDTLPHGFGQGDDRVRLTCQRGLSFQGEAVPLTATAVVGSFTGQPALLQESTQLVHHGDTQGPSHVECDGGVLVATCCVQNGGSQLLGQGGDAPDGVVDAFLHSGVVLTRGDAVVGDAFHLDEWCGVLVL